MERLDVLIVGAGPAGSALALGLRRKGVERVLLVDKPSDRPFPVGESATPDVLPSLRRLGFDGELQDFGHRPFHGMNSRWADGATIRNHFLFRGQGHGWHLDRKVFDKTLQQQAQTEGARLISPDTLAKVRVMNRGWQVQLRETGQELQTRVLVDASGRKAAAASRLNINRIRLDSLVALAVKTPPSDPLRGGIVVEAARDGWWYAVDLPGGECIVMLMSDTDQIHAGCIGDPQVFQSRWRETELLREYVPVPDKPMAKPIAFAATSGYLKTSIAPGFIALGDALLSFDPLTSSGIAAALSDAEAAIDPILHWLASDNQAYAQSARTYATRAENSLRRYLVERSKRYNEVARFRDHPFWQRRVRPSL